MPAKGLGPWATALIAGLTVLAYAWAAFMPDAELDRVHAAFAVRADAPRAVPILAHAALHSSLLHLAINVALLVGFGPAVEGRARGWALLLVYVLSGIAGGLAHVALASGALRGMALVGASGAVSGVMAAHAALLPSKRIALAVVVAWALANLAGLLIDRAGAYGISYPTHLGGLAAGALIGAVLGKLVKR